VPWPARDTLTLTVVPAGLVLLAIALAERWNAEGAVFYLFLAGIPVSAVGGLAAFGRLVDAVNGGLAPTAARIQGVLSGTLVALFVFGAAGRSPVSLELGAPGLGHAALVLAAVVLALQAIAALAPVRR
jgi:hypothetical protein